MGEGQLRQWLDALAALGGVVSAAEAVVFDGEAILFRHAAGYRAGGERLVAGAGARFDAASLTKPWMATLALALDGGAAAGEEREEKKKIRLREEVVRPSERPSGGGEGERGGFVLEDLLRHRAGLVPWLPLGAKLGKGLADRSRLIDLLLAARREGAGGSAPVAAYSDLDYLLWGLLAEARMGEGLAGLLDRHVCAPLGLVPLGAMAAGPEVPDAVECRLDNGKEVELAAVLGVRLALQRSFLRGVPQDGNARALRAAGVPLAAHAGLFVTADELLALGREWLRPGRVLAPAAVAAALAGEGPWALGWARWSVDGSSGPALSPRSFGHAGFTGGSLWVDPERGRVYVLLAHRLRSTVDFNPFRREFHRLAAEL